MDGPNVAQIIWTYIPPVIIIAGTIGNVLSLMTVTNRHCRKSSFTVYLAALAITDTAYLYLAVFGEWLINTFTIQFIYGKVWCKVVYFLSFLTSQTSSWLVAALATERTLCTYFPHKTKAVCVPRTGYIVVGTITGVLFLMNAHLLYAVQGSDVANNNTLQMTCGIVVPGYEIVYASIFTWVDLGLYFLLPIFIIVIANSATVVRVLRRNASTAAPMAINSNRIKQTRHLLIITLLVSFAFIIFLSPLVVFAVVMPHFYEDISPFPGNNNNIDYIIWTSLSNWSYVNHAVNFCLYVLSGERFRRDLKNVICKSSAEHILD